MANTTVYPFGTDGTLPSSVGIVDDLKTGGSSSALSAEQGLVINEKFGTVSQVLSSSRTESVCISSSDGTLVNVSSSSSNTPYVCTFSCEEDLVIFVSGRVGTATQYIMVAFYDEDDEFISGALPFGAGTTITDYKLISPEGTKTVKIAGNGALNSPATLYYLQEDTLQKRVSQLETDVIKKVYTYTNIQSCGATITNNNVWMLSDKYYGALLDVSAYHGYFVDIVANQSHQSIYAYLKSGVSSGNTPDYATGYTERKYVQPGTKLRTMVPNDASLLYIYMASPGIIFTPSDVYVCKYLKDIDNATENEDKVSLMTYNIGHFSGGVRPNSSINSSNYAAKLDAFRALISTTAPDIYGVVEYSAIFGQNTSGNSVNTKDVLFDLATTTFESSQLHYACYALFANRMPIYNVTINDFDCLQDETITHTTLIEAQDYRYISSDLYAFGVSIKLIIIHFAFDQNRTGVLQSAQLNELITKYSSSPYVVIMGDFNYNVEDMEEAVTNAGYSMANDGSYKTYPSGEKGRLDNILVKGLQISDVRMVSSALSDHNPLFCNISL